MIAELLNRGRERARTSDDLMRACGLMSKRELTNQIARERENGIIILSTTAGNGGYYLPKNREEVQQFINSMEARAQNTLKAVKCARKLLNETSGQMSLQDIIEGREAASNATKENDTLSTMADVQR